MCEVVSGFKAERFGPRQQPIQSSSFAAVCCLLLCSTFVPFRAAGGEFVWLLTFPEHQAERLLSACTVSPPQLNDLAHFNTPIIASGLIEL